MNLIMNSLLIGQARPGPYEFHHGVWFTEALLCGLRCGLAGQGHHTSGLLPQVGRRGGQGGRAQKHTHPVCAPDLGV